MLRVYLGSAVGLVLMGQSGGTQGAQLLDQALASDPSVGPILNEAAKLAGLGIPVGDAAVIIAVSGLLWKFLDVQQKGGTVDTLNLWLRRKLKVDNPPPSAKP